jgi:hypothetical protein
MSDKLSSFLQLSEVIIFKFSVQEWHKSRVGMDTAMQGSHGVYHNVRELWRFSVLREMLIEFSCKQLIFVYNKNPYWVEPC